MEFGLQDDLPLLSCHMLMKAGDAFGVAVGVGLCPGEVLLATVLPPAAATTVADPIGAEPVKRAKLDHELTVYSHRLALVGNHGCYNAVLLHEVEHEAKKSERLLSLLLGCQNGNLVRVSLSVGAERVQTVGSPQVLHSHRMDIRGLSVHEHMVCSCSDDGTLLLSSLLGSQTRDPIVVSEEEVLCCVFSGPHVVYAATRDRKVVRIHLGTENKRQAEVKLEVRPCGQVVRFIGAAPDGAVILATASGFQRWQETTWTPVTLSRAQVAQTFQVAAANI